MVLLAAEIADSDRTAPAAAESVGFRVQGLGFRVHV
jgi:hypothetical protein